MPEAVKIGLVGCGAISGNYLTYQKNFPILDIVAVADMIPEKAKARAEEFGVPKVLTVDEMLADPEIEVILNLTVPLAHAPLELRALEAGKHSFSEKPLGVTRKEAQAVLDLAKQKGLRVGCAPDTFLGAGLQTARRAIDEGMIGRPVSCIATWQCPGHERWHPSPRFFYEPGAGPMFDMGPYYLTALLQLLGGVKRYSGVTSIAIPERTCSVGPDAGKSFSVETPDIVTGLLEFDDGVVGTIFTSFASQYEIPGGVPIVVHGTEGSLRVPDPNCFDGEVFVRRTGADDWSSVPFTTPTGYGRAVGLADMCTAIHGSGRPHRCSGEQAFYVVDLMEGFLNSSDENAFRKPVMSYTRPAPMPTDKPFGTLDD